MIILKGIYIAVLMTSGSRELVLAHTLFTATDLMTSPNISVQIFCGIKACSLSHWAGCVYRDLPGGYQRIQAEVSKS